MITSPGLAGSIGAPCPNTAGCHVEPCDTTGISVYRCGLENARLRCGNAVIVLFRRYPWVRFASAFRSIACTASALALILTTACGGGDGGNAPTGPSGTAIAIVAGNFQLAKYGTPVPIAPAVKVTGTNGPVAGVQVTFAPVAGSGSVTGGTATTDANGVATVGSWTLSPAPGVNTLKATAGSLTASISATAVAGRPGRDHVEGRQQPEWRRALARD